MKYLVYEEVYYKTKISSSMIEHEYVHVFKAEYENQEFHLNPREVSEYNWMKMPDIMQDIEDKHYNYAPWFLHYLKEHKNTIFQSL